MAQFDLRACVVSIRHQSGRKKKLWTLGFCPLHTACYFPASFSTTTITKQI